MKNAKIEEMTNFGKREPKCAQDAHALKCMLAKHMNHVTFEVVVSPQTQIPT
jgi:hypothetical protein